LAVVRKHPYHLEVRSFCTCFLHGRVKPLYEQTSILNTISPPERDPNNNLLLVALEKAAFVLEACVEMNVRTSMVLLWGKCNGFYMLCCLWKLMIIRTCSHWDHYRLHFVTWWVNLRLQLTVLYQWRC